MTRRLTVNLIDNAIRYTEPGGTVTATLVEDDAFATLRVTDTGIGIASEHQASVFERFVRLDSSRQRTREIDGSGLGLPLCRQIAELHGGAIDVQSAPGQGSTFMVRLPSRRQQRFLPQRFSVSSSAPVRQHMRRATVRQSFRSPWLSIRTRLTRNTNRAAERSSAAGRCHMGRQWAALIAAFIVLTGWAGCALADCPPGAIASRSTLISDPKLGTIAVEACVTRDGLEDTYTYEITRLSGGSADVSGFRLLTHCEVETTSMPTLPGWRSETTLAPDDCGTWWDWSVIATSIVGGSLGIGETVTFSMTVERPAVPFRNGLGTLMNAAGASVNFRTLVPQICAPAWFEGDGTRILVIGGDAVQTIQECDAAWVRHGVTLYGEDVDLGAADWALFIDGGLVPMDMMRYCEPGIGVGERVNQAMASKQFAPGYFTVGRYELRGVWTVPPSDEFPALVFEQTITLVVEPCLSPPDPPISTAPGSPFPDLIVEIMEVECSCEWTPQQKRVCEVTAVVVVTNQGSVPSESTGLMVSFGHIRKLKAVPRLTPGETRAEEIVLTFEIDPQEDPRCDVDVEAAVDFSSLIEEMDEANNTDVVEICCQ